MTKKTLAIVLSAIASLLVIAIIAVLLVSSGAKNNSMDNLSDSDTSQSTVETQALADDPAAYREHLKELEAELEPGKALGASVDGSQRSWPTYDGTDIDSQFATPGQYGVDVLYSRRVFTPINPLGDLPSSSDLNNEPGICEDYSLPGMTQLQYVKARFLVVNTEAGPSTMVRGVPRGYAHSTAGAVVAAINQYGYGTPLAGDPIGQEIDKQLWSTSQYIQEERKIRHLDLHDGSLLNRAGTEPGATAFRIVSCAPDLVLVEVILGDSTQFPLADMTSSRVLMRWSDGDWNADFSGANDHLNQSTTVTSLDGYTRVVYQ